jgi:hypothetical protein
MSELEAGNSIDFESDPSRRVFIYVTSGDLGVNGERLMTKDQARVGDEKSIRLEAYEDTSLILIDVPSRNGE